MPDVNTTGYASYIATSSSASTSVAAAMVSNQDDHEANGDYTWDSSTVVTITLNGDSISASSLNGVTISGAKVTIKSAGTYSISGTLSNGQIVVEAANNSVVRLILNGASVSNAANASIYVESAKKAIIVLAAGTNNVVMDNAGNVADGALFSRADLTICGSGSLTVNGNANDAIRSNDGLIIKSGTIAVTSVDDGICGRDYLVIKGGTVTVNSVGDGLKSDNTQDADRGYIYIEGGTIAVTSTSGDAVSAETDLLIANGTVTLTSGGGGNVAKNGAVSTKGLKGGVNVVIDNGDFAISSSDDAIHSNSTIFINNGIFRIATGDDAMHADTSLEINGGAFDITQCFEGLESSVITINNGYIQINSSDDGINIAGGNNGVPADPFAPPDAALWLYIKGGYIVIDSVADGIDTNGYMEMSNGFLIINGPTVDFDGAIDYASATFKLTGGTIIAVGSSGMAQGPSTISTQYSVLVFFTSKQTPKLVNLQTASGETVFTFSPTKTFQSIVFSSSKLATGSYNLYLGGSSTGTITHGLYEGGTYTPGSKYTSFTISSIVTTIGGGGFFFPFP
jgi:hypothetical protein